MNNPYNRVYPSDPQYAEAQYFIICTDADTQLATRAAFLTYEDAKRYCDTINPCYKAKVLKVCEEE